MVILSWRDPEPRKALTASRFKLFKVPTGPVAGLATMGIIIYNLYEWQSNSGYGVNNHGSPVFRALFYAGAIIVYLVARVIRKRQGIDLGIVDKEISLE